jgi:hypothetical protein
MIKWNEIKSDKDGKMFTDANMDVVYAINLLDERGIPKSLPSSKWLETLENNND